MFVRVVTVLWFVPFAYCLDAAADILRCQLKSSPPGYQELLVDIVLPNKEDYRYELGLLDTLTKDIRQLPRSDAIPWPIQKWSAKALGTIETRTRVIGGEYGRTDRSHLVVFGAPSKNDIIAFMVRDGLRQLLPGMIRVDLTPGKKVITMTDTTHLEGRLSIYEGTCE